MPLLGPHFSPGREARARRDGGSGKANATQGAQTYSTVRRAPWPRSRIRRERIRSHAVRPKGARQGRRATAPPMPSDHVRSRGPVRYAGWWTIARQGGGAARIDRPMGRSVRDPPLPRIAPLPGRESVSGPRPGRQGSVCRPGASDTPPRTDGLTTSAASMSRISTRIAGVRPSSFIAPTRCFAMERSTLSAGIRRPVDHGSDFG